jgi:hypothetical protein
MLYMSLLNKKFRKRKVLYTVHLRYANIGRAEEGFDNVKYNIKKDS